MIDTTTKNESLPKSDPKGQKSDPPVQLFIGGIPPTTKRSKFEFFKFFIEELKDFFNSYGELSECRMMKDKTTSKKNFVIF